MQVGPVELIILGVLLGLPIWGIVDALSRPGRAWEAAGHNQAVWVIVQIIFLFLGPIVYLVAIRPRLRAAGSPRA